MWARAHHGPRPPTAAEGVAGPALECDSAWWSLWLGPSGRRSPIKEPVTWRRGLKYLLVVLGILALLFGLFVFVNGKSAVHEIEGLMGCLIFAVCMGSAAILEELQGMRRTQRPPA